MAGRGNTGAAVRHAGAAVHAVLGIRTAVHPAQRAAKHPGRRGRQLGHDSGVRLASSGGALAAPAGISARSGALRRCRCRILLVAYANIAVFRNECPVFRNECPVYMHALYSMCGCPPAAHPPPPGAGMSCIALTRTAPDLSTASSHLQDAVSHFQRAMEVLQQQQASSSSSQAVKRAQVPTSRGVLWGSPGSAPSGPPSPVPPSVLGPLELPPQEGLLLAGTPGPDDWLQRGAVAMSMAELATAVTQCTLQREVYEAMRVAAVRGKRGTAAVKVRCGTCSNGVVSASFFFFFCSSLPHTLSLSPFPVKLVKMACVITTCAQAVASISPMDCSLFPPNVPMSASESAVAVEARLSQLLETLLRCDFDLAFRCVFSQAMLQQQFLIFSYHRVVHEFGLVPVRAYAGAAAAMARANNHDALGQLLVQVEGMLTDDERDQVLAAGVQGYLAGGWGGVSDWSHSFAGGLGNPAERLVELMRDVAARVGGYCRLGLLDQALAEALTVEDVGCVAMVLDAARATPGNDGVVATASNFLQAAYGWVHS